MVVAIYIYIAAATPHYQNNININLKKKKVRRNVFFFKAILPLWQRRKCHTTFSNGCLGSHNDEERSEMRYVMRSANSRESSNLWTHIALPVTTGSMLIWVSANPTLPTTACWLGRRTLAFHDVLYILWFAQVKGFARWHVQKCKNFCACWNLGIVHMVIESSILQLCEIRVRPPFHTLIGFVKTTRN